MAAEVRWLTQEVLVGAQSGWMQKKLHKHVGGNNQDKKDPQQCWENTVEEQPGEQSNAVELNTHEYSYRTVWIQDIVDGRLTCSSCCQHSCWASDNDGQS